jgi:hypothetical protein
MVVQATMALLALALAKTVNQEAQAILADLVPMANAVLLVSQVFQAYQVVQVLQLLVKLPHVHQHQYLHLHRFQ